LELILFPHADMDKRRFRQLIANPKYRMVLRAAPIWRHANCRKGARCSHLKLFLCDAKNWFDGLASITWPSAIFAIRHR
ncbi:hypothetical protein, partial [Proteus mirabilis]|uniref:hypothetical protein n=1 Tax=Proteus mirabilis TaxID=584 RepID=UPI00195448BB